jgi:hypothetical protein
MCNYANKLEKLKKKIEEYEKIIAEYNAKKQRLEEQYEELCRQALAEMIQCDPKNINSVIMSDPSILQKLNSSSVYNAKTPKRKELNNVSADEDADELKFCDTITNNTD